MAEEWLEELYTDANGITQIKEVIRLYEQGYDLIAAEIWNGLIPWFKEVRDKYNRLLPNAGSSLYTQLKSITTDMKDYLQFSCDLYTMIIPELYRYMKCYGHIDVEDGDYRIESSQSGYLSLTKLKSNCLIHGKSDPMEDARVNAESIYSAEYDEYCILGSGFGYLPYQLYRISGGAAKVRVYETDVKLLQYGRNYGVLDWIPKENLYIENDIDIMKFLQYVDQHAVGCYVSEWFLDDLPENEKEALQKVYMAYSVSRDVEDRNFAINFWKNMENEFCCFSDLLGCTMSKDFIVAAAGPSLDESIGFIQANREKMVVIAVGTVFRKLMKLGIEPDYVAVLESHELVYQQFEGLEEKKVPLIMPMCAYWKIAEKYKGKKYLFPSCDCAESIKYAETHGEEIWGVGGTVSYTAIEAAIRLGAHNIYLLGLDLAFPDALSHAVDTPQRRKLDVSNYSLIDQVGGGKVYSDYAFSLYREAIEKLILMYPKVNFYNLSKIGAKIKGTMEL